MTNNVDYGRYFKILALHTLIIATILLGIHWFVESPLERRGWAIGNFFYWEVAIILHTLIVFRDFKNDRDIDQVLSRGEKLNAVVLIYTLIGISLAIYLLIVSDLFKGHGSEFLRDSITFFPMVIYFLCNSYFFMKFRDDAKKRKFFANLIIFLDFPFLLPYTLTAIYLLVYPDGAFEKHTFLSGVASVLMLCSNFVTSAFKAIVLTETPAGAEAATRS